MPSLIIHNFSCPQNVKEAAYKSMVRPILEYGSSVWDPHPDKLKEELEKVQNRAARFVTRNYVYETGSMTGILGQLKWESLKKRRKDNRLILLYKGLKGKARIPTDDLIPKTRRGRNQHSLAFQIPSAGKDVYMYSFFPQTIRDWNDLLNPWFLPLNCQMIAYLSSPLLWELGTNFPQSQPLVKDCQFGVSPVNYSDSDSDNYEFESSKCDMSNKKYFSHKIKQPDNSRLSYGSVNVI